MGYDTKALNETLVTWKEKLGLGESLILLATDSTEYRAIVATMDAVRMNGNKMLFPDVALGTASAVTNAMAAAGVKFDFLISSSLPAAGDAALAEHIKAIEAFAAKYKGSVIAVEGLNEANIQAFSYKGSSSLAAAGAWYYFKGRR
jgi:hypothetical protein